MKALLLICSLLVFSGCTTVIPPHVDATVVKFSGNDQNAGLVGVNTNGGFIITPDARDRYNGLVAVYGSRFIPPLKQDAGLTNSPLPNWTIDSQHFVSWESMSRWDREKPKPQ